MRDDTTHTITKDIESLLVLIARAIARDIENDIYLTLWTRAPLDIVFANLLSLLSLHPAKLGGILWSMLKKSEAIMNNQKSSCLIA